MKPMKGNIKAYSDAVSAGFIEGHDGRNYQFNITDWSGTAVPVSAEEVTFIGGNNRALEIKQA